MPKRKGAVESGGKDMRGNSILTGLLGKAARRRGDHAGMRKSALFLSALLALTAAPAAARDLVTSTVTGTVEEVTFGSQGGSERIVGMMPPALPRGIAAYGPFRVLDATRAALVDVTDSRSPAQFAAMLKAHPGIEVLEMLECPGTEDDRANLALGRLIHGRGIATHVPAGGSVRSGGVELFLAGSQRRIDDGAEFAVHAWEDEDGREATDFPADAPQNRAYLDYYRDMGMTPQQASAFYAMTNSVSFEQAKWLTAADMRVWVSLN